jgi:hypothetical protein
MEVPAAHLSALRSLIACLPLAEINWALTGSTAHALQGVPVEPHDIDVQTDEPGTWKAADALADYCVAAPRRVESQLIRSLLGSYTIEGITVELIGAMQKRGFEDSWAVPTDPAEHRRFVRLGDLQIPVLSLEYEAVAYAELGRHERAELLRRHAAATNIQP